MSDANLDSTIVIALRAAGGLIVLWVAQTLFLVLVPMLTGNRPDFGRAFQVAVWSSVPLGVMAALQIVYLESGGVGGERIGLSAVLDTWDGLAALPPMLAALVTVCLESLTLWALWSLLLLYLGARFGFARSAQNGAKVVPAPALASMLIVILYTSALIAALTLSRAAVL
ncbi:MAG: hypothetical protein IPK19_37345 [Chloroflexi bacterium]|nr:hypothetical protein [Chloroflexota bacterium]